MKNFANRYLNWYNNLSKGIKAILCLLWDVPNNLARFSQSALKDNIVGMVLAIVLAIVGGWILFLVDLICLLLNDKIYWLDDLGLEEATENLFKSTDNVSADKANGTEASESAAAQSTDGESENENK